MIRSATEFYIRRRQVTINDNTDTSLMPCRLQLAVFLNAYSELSRLVNLLCHSNL